MVALVVVELMKVPVGVEFMELLTWVVELWVELKSEEVKVLFTDNDVVAVKLRFNLDKSLFWN